MKKFSTQGLCTKYLAMIDFGKKRQSSSGEVRSVFDLERGDEWSFCQEGESS